jgi:hypothetical protein
MKTTLLKISALALIPAVFACNSSDKSASASDSTATATEADGATVSNASYVNLSTGEPVTIEKGTSGSYIYTESQKPVEEELLFVDVSTGDTLYGPTGVLVNNAVIRDDAGMWTVDGAKVKQDGDELKVKSGDAKLKVDGEDAKLKVGDSKVKTDDGESKTKTPQGKQKVEDDEVKVKP